jgi:hypothetical protein
LDSSKQDLSAAALLVPAKASTGGVGDIAGRCLLSAMFICAFWWLVLVTDLGSSTFVTFAFAAAFLIHISLRTNKAWELPAVVIAGLAYALAYAAHGGRFVILPGSYLGITAAFLGVGSLAVKSTRGIWETDAKAIRSNRTNLIEVATIPLLCVLSVMSVSMAAADFTPKTYDLFLHAFDFALGFEPSFAMGQFFRSHIWIAYPSAVAYNYLPIGLGALRALQLREDKPGIDVRLIYAALGAAGFCLYAICPAAGPVYCFSGFPYGQPAAAGFPIEMISVPPVPRNAMPSLHMGWALLVFANSWSRSRSRWAVPCALVFVALTAFATLGSGEHYLIDLIVAVPLTLAVQTGFTATGPLRNLAVSTGAVLTIGWMGWMLALRTGVLVAQHSSPVLPWALVLATLIASLALYVKVARASR